MFHVVLSEVLKHALPFSRHLDQWFPICVPQGPRSTWMVWCRYFFATLFIVIRWCIYIYIYIYILSPLWRCGPTGAMASSSLRFLDFTQRRITVGRLLRTGDQLVAETSTWQHTTLNNTQTSMSPGGIETHDLKRPAAADLRLRPRGHWDRFTTRLLSDTK